MTKIKCLGCAVFFSVQMIVLCADVEVAELKGVVAMFNEVVLEVAEVDIVVVGLLCR